MILKKVLKIYNMKSNIKTVKYFLLSFIVLLTISCSSQNCSELNENFTSYAQAKNSIESARFNFSDKCNTSKSSWILGAKYYSCNNKDGYFLIRTKEKKYIHQGLPKELWKEFKKAESFGEFYNLKIKSKYRLII